MDFGFQQSALPPFVRRAGADRGAGTGTKPSARGPIDGPDPAPAGGPVGSGLVVAPGSVDVRSGAPVGTWLHDLRLVLLALTVTLFAPRGNLSAWPTFRRRDDQLVTLPHCALGRSLASFHSRAVSLAMEFGLVALAVIGAMVRVQLRRHFVVYTLLRDPALHTPVVRFRCSRSWARNQCRGPGKP